MPGSLSRIFPKGLRPRSANGGSNYPAVSGNVLPLPGRSSKTRQSLILDEATNALDSESEKYVQESLEEFMQGRTVIIIAHRLSTLRKADMIYVLDESGIHEKGNHSELLKQKGVYRMLYEIQAGGFEKQAHIMKEYDIYRPNMR